MQPLDSVPMAWLAPLPFGCRRTPFELMDFGLESSQLVLHPFSSQREFALRIVACEPPPQCAAAPPLKTGPKRHTSLEVSVCSWTSTMIWTWTCQSIFIVECLKAQLPHKFMGLPKRRVFWSLIFGTVSEGIIYPRHPQKIAGINKSPWFDSAPCKTPIKWQLRNIPISRP